MESILKYIIAAIFGLAIFGKLTSKTKSTFDKAGYSGYFMYGVALAELVLTIGLFTHYAFYSIIGLLVILFGAILTLFRQKAKSNQYILSNVTIGLLLKQWRLQYAVSIQIK